MSYADVPHDEGYDEENYVVPRRVRRRRKKKKRGGSFLAVLFSLAIVGGLGFGVYQFGSGVFDEVGGFFGPPADYDGPGTVEVIVTIEPGTSLSGIGGVLEENDVVASSDAFVDAADGQAIQAGVYTLKQQMKASDAVAMMVQGADSMAQVTIPEGLRVRQTYEKVAEGSDFTVEELEEAASSLELPAYAGGNAPEGFLFPATYDLSPESTPESLLTAMIDRYGVAVADTSLVEASEAAGLEPLESLTIASIIQREVREIEDMSGVAEVIFNRLNDECSEVAEQRLQMDSTVHYALDEYGEVTTTDDQRQVDSPYNTYREGGLPPGPIASPGEDAIEAVFNPTDEGYCYFRSDLDTGETKFSRTSEEHNQ
jgi:UPF0755 protein